MLIIWLPKLSSSYGHYFNTSDKHNYLYLPSLRDRNRSFLGFTLLYFKKNVRTNPWKVINTHEIKINVLNIFFFLNESNNWMQKTCWSGLFLNVSSEGENTGDVRNRMQFHQHQSILLCNMFTMHSSLYNSSHVLITSTIPTTLMHQTKHFLWRHKLWPSAISSCTFRVSR